MKIGTNEESKSSNIGQKIRTYNERAEVLSGSIGASNVVATNPNVDMNRDRFVELTFDNVLQGGQYIITQLRQSEYTVSSVEGFRV